MAKGPDRHNDIITSQIQLSQFGQKTMTNSQRLQIKSSELRARLNELSALEELDDETRSQLDIVSAEYQDTETQLRAALLSEGEAETRALTSAPDAELRERRELRGRARVSNYLLSAMKGTRVDGAEAELAAAAGAGANYIPMELWEGSEERAVAITPTVVGINLDRLRPAVFAQSVLPRLGVEMPRVESGTYASATISTSQSAASYAESAAAAGVAGAFTVTTTSPHRISARLELTLESIAAVGQENFESILRENIALALADELDNQGLNGTGGGNDLAGIFQRLTDPSAPPAGVSDFDRFAAQHASGIDGLWAPTLMDVSILAGPETYRLASQVFQTATNYKGEMSAAAYAMSNTGGLWTNKRMPVTATNIQQAILYRKARSFLNMSEGYSRTALCPIWSEIGIDDVYSGSAKGERYFTMHVLLGDVIIVQPDAYAQVAYRVSV